MCLNKKVDILIDNRTNNKLPEQFEDIVRSVINEALRLEGDSADREVSVSFVTDDEIRKLNKRFRGLDKETDVLSFPMDEDAFLGDIVINYAYIYSQAADYGHSPERELGFLTAHGTLHLLGYDHMQDDDEQEMLSKQEQILNAVGLHRI